jgi:HD-GYP domain-containing protein (c-di-GMP phosphodiesterase class II)
MFLAKACGRFDRKTIEQIGFGGFLHDLGYTKVPREILDKRDQLSPAEWEEVKSHPQKGLEMIEKARNVPDEVRFIMYQHHEDPRGSGYPNGLNGASLYYPARIVSVADAFSALISDRPYRAKYPIAEAIRVLDQDREKYDPFLVDILKYVFIERYKVKNAA